MSELIQCVKKMATRCGLQNSEQISEEQTAMGAVRMIESEYLDLREKYCNLLRSQTSDRAWLSRHGF